MNSKPIANIVKGDSFSLEGDLDTDITGWMLRCEIYDSCSNSIKLATANSGGADDQIQITDASNGQFIINIAKDLTSCFEDKSFIEIEGETADSPTKKFTIHQGDINFKPEEITWETP